MLSPLLKKLLFVRQFSIDEGKINVLGTDHIMLSSDALLKLQEIDSTKLYDLVKDSTFKQISDFVDHAQVYQQLKEVITLDITSLSKKLGPSEGIVKTIEEIFNIYGLGKLAILRLDNEKKQASVKIIDSSIAKSYLNKNKSRSKTAVCTITAAVLAGMFSYLFKKQVDAVEGRCKAKGNEHCEFIIK